MPLAISYFNIVLLGIPFLALSMMANNNLRAEGKAKVAMVALLIPSVLNIFLDYLFIDIMNWGMEGAGWATSISYIGCAVFIAYFYISGKGELKVIPQLFKIDKKIISEIFSIGSVNLVRQGTISLLAIVLNNTLYYYGNLEGGMGGEIAISVYGLATRMTMFALFPLIGIAQGFMPIAGYNFGAKKYERVSKVINTALISGYDYCFVYWGITGFWSRSNSTYFHQRSKTYHICTKCYILDFFLYANYCFSFNSSFFLSSYWQSKTCSLSYFN